MKSSSSSLFIATIALGLLAPASGQMISVFDFDGVPSGSPASLFSTPDFSFRQAMFAPQIDEFGDPVSGSEYWQIDWENDALFPVTVENPEDYGRGPAPSGTNALQALWQPVLISFSETFRLSSFAVTLDNDPFGFMEQIVFLQGSSILQALWVDQTLAGQMVAFSGPLDVTGVVLPAGAFYDNLQLAGTPVPEPSTYGLFAVGGIGLLAWMRRRRMHAST